MTSNHLGRIVLVFLAFAAASLGWYGFSRYRAAPGRAQPHNPLGFANLGPDVQYVGDRACTTCHTSIAESYAGTAMARSWRRAADAELIEDYENPHTVVDSVTGYRYEVRREGDRFFQREYRVNDQGEVTYSQVREVAYVLGAGSKGRSYVTDSNGYLTVMPVAWYSGEKKWDLNPGYRRSNERFAREVVPACIMCHNSYPDYVAGSHNRYRPTLPEGIGCERCHGPGELHVTRRRQKNESASSGELDLTIVNPAKLPAGLQQDVCLQCHFVTKEVSMFHRGTGAFAFRPGQPLGDFRADFQRTDATVFTSVSHGSRAALSRCSTESNGRFTCIFCHDPHVPIEELPSGFFNSRCLVCHQSEACSRSPEPPDGALLPAAHRANDCVACHMPSSIPSDVDHTVTTDHWIRGRAALPEVQPDETAAVVELQDFLGASGIAERGIAHAVYGARTKRPGNIARGVSLLRKAIRQQPDDPRLQYWLGFALLYQGNGKEALSHLERTLRLIQKQGAGALTEAEQTDLYQDLAEVYERIGQRGRALEVVEMLVEAMPECVSGYVLSANFNALLRRNEAALRVARAGLDRDPANAELWKILGLIQSEGENDLSQATASLGRSIELDPIQPTTNVALAKAYEKLNQPAEAERAWLRALELEPENIPALLALAELYIRQDRPQDAKLRLRQILYKSPLHPDALRLLNQVSKD